MVKWIHQKEKEVNLNIIKFIIDIVALITSISVLVLVIKNREFLADLEKRIRKIEEFMHSNFAAELWAFRTGSKLVINKDDKK